MLVTTNLLHNIIQQWELLLSGCGGGQIVRQSLAAVEVLDTLQHMDDCFLSIEQVPEAVWLHVDIGHGARHPHAQHQGYNNAGISTILSHFVDYDESGGYQPTEICVVGTMHRTVEMTAIETGVPSRQTVQLPLALGLVTSTIG